MEPVPVAPLAVPVTNAVHVIRASEGISVARAPVDVEPLSRKQVDARIDARGVQGLGSRPESIEIALVKLRQIESKSTIGCIAGTCSQPGMRTNGEIWRRTGPSSEDRRTLAALYTTGT